MRSLWMTHSWISMMTRAGRKEDAMKAIKLLLAVMFAFLAVTVPVYWFNLDTKAVKLLEKTMMKHYDSLKRDNRL